MLSWSLTASRYFTELSPDECINLYTHNAHPYRQCVSVHAIDKAIPTQGYRKGDSGGHLAPYQQISRQQHSHCIAVSASPGFTWSLDTSLFG